MKHPFQAALAALLALCALSGAAAQEMSLPGDTPVQAAEASVPPAVPVERYFLLLFDSPLGGIRQMDEVSAAVEEWISGELLPADAVAVVSYYGQELLIAQDFTRDRQALVAAVSAAVRGQVHASATAEAGSPSLLARLPQGEALTRRAEDFYGALQVLAETVDSVPGPKGLLVFSKGFGRSRLPGLSEMMVAGPEMAISPEALAESPVLEKYLPEPSLYEPTLEALLSRQIRLYPVDLATDYRETFPLAGVMSRLAAETDGRYVYPVTELPRVLEQIAQTDVSDGDRLADRQTLSPITTSPLPSLSAGVQAE